MTEHGHQLLSRLVFIGREGAPERRLNAEDIEIMGGNSGTSQLHWFSGTGQRDVPSSGIPGHIVENRVLSLPVQKIQRRYAVSGKTRRFLQHPNDAVGIGVGQRL